MVCSLILSRTLLLSITYCSGLAGWLAALLCLASAYVAGFEFNCLFANHRHRTTAPLAVKKLDCRASAGVGIIRRRAPNTRVNYYIVQSLAS